MFKTITALLVCAAAQAATLNTTLTVNASLAASSSGAYNATGTAALTGGISDSGTFSGTLNLSSLESGGTSISAPFTMTLKSGTMGGTLQIPLAAFEAILSGATSASGLSATITSATGSYAGDSGTFPSLSGSGATGASGITLNFSGSGTITTGGTVTAPPPAITAVADDASYTANVAQGSLFVVKGTNLSASGYTPAPALPYPTSLGTTQVTFTPVSGGTGTQAYLFYTYNESGVNQLGGILPSTLATGTYNVTVTYNNATSAAFQTQVVKSKPGVFTQDTTGTGLAAVQNAVSATEIDLNRLTTGSISGITISPAKPGQTLIAWVTGLGAVSYADNIVPPQAYNFPGVQVLVNGTAITPLYAGASGYPGLDQINFTLPANVTTGCTVPLQISINGVTSTTTTIAIAPSASASACVLPGYTSSQLQSLDNGATITAGGFALSQIVETVTGLGTLKIDSASGGFTQVTGFELQALPFSYSSNTVGSCTVIQVSGSAGQLSAAGTVTNLDAGKVTLSGPSGTNLNNTAFTETNNLYSLTIGEEGISIPGGLNGTIVAGTYSLAGPGGKDVGSFNTSITLGTPLNITGGLPSAVTRSQGLTLNWSGGNATDAVEIIGYSGSTSGSGTSAVTTATEFICTTTAGQDTFTVPASVLTQLPATPPSSANGAGFLEVASGPTPVSFTPSLTAGGSVASTFSALVATGALVTYQ